MISLNRNNETDAIVPPDISFSETEIEGAIVQRVLETDIPDNAASRLEYVSAGRVHVMYSTVFGLGDQTGSCEGRAALPEAYGDPGVEAAHEEEWYEIEEDEIHHVQNVLIVLLDIGYANDVDIAIVETIADGLNVKKSGRGVHGR